MSGFAIYAAAVSRRWASRYFVQAPIHFALCFTFMVRPVLSFDDSIAVYESAASVTLTVPVACISPCLQLVRNVTVLPAAFNSETWHCLAFSGSRNAFDTSFTCSAVMHCVLLCGRVFLSRDSVSEVTSYLPGRRSTFCAMASASPAVTITRTTSTDERMRVSSLSLKLFGHRM